MNITKVPAAEFRKTIKTFLKENKKVSSPNSIVVGRHLKAEGFLTLKDLANVEKKTGKLAEHEIKIGRGKQVYVNVKAA